MIVKYISKSPKETQELAKDLMKKLKNLTYKNAVVVALEGELGAGKTTFVQGMAKALKIKARVKSPTFSLMKSYKLKTESYKLLFHIDCYRLRDHKDLELLGITDILNNPENLVLIEWADRVKEILPKKHITIHIDHISEKERKISIK